MSNLDKLEQLKSKLDADVKVESIDVADIEAIVRKVVKEELQVNQDMTVKRVMNYVYNQRKDVASILGRKLNTLIDRVNKINKEIDNAKVEDPKEAEKRELLARLKELESEV